MHLNTWLSENKDVPIRPLVSFTIATIIESNIKLNNDHTTKYEYSFSDKSDDVRILDFLSSSHFS